jgi:hypothetical protein
MPLSPPAAVYIAPTPDPVTPVAAFAPPAATEGAIQTLSTSVVAAEGATGNGDLVVTTTVTNDEGIVLSLANALPLLSATHTTAALIAAALRTMLEEDPFFDTFCNVSGTGADVVIGYRDYHPNDPHFALVITPGLGVTQGAVTHVAGALPSPSAIW